ncbi:MAG: 16S rRNA processing protein RimM [Rickettsiales bacterium]|jgi:16S rRNA processing protein RimM
MENISIAKITSAHGIKGLVKIMSFASNPCDIEEYVKTIFDSSGNPLKIKIIRQIPSANNDLFIAEIEGSEDRNSSESLRGTELFIKKEDLIKYDEDEFFYCDLIGLDVLDPQKKKIGKVEAVHDFGAGGLVEIKFSDEKYSKNKISDFAFTDETFPEVNIAEGFLIFDLPDIIEALDADKE